MGCSGQERLPFLRMRRMSSTQVQYTRTPAITRFLPLSVLSLSWYSTSAYLLICALDDVSLIYACLNFPTLPCPRLYCTGTTDKMEDGLMAAMSLVPSLAECGIKQMVHGPDTHSVDHEPLLDRAPQTDNLWYVTALCMHLIYTHDPESHSHSHSQRCQSVSYVCTQ